MPSDEAATAKLLKKQGAEIENLSKQVSELHKMLATFMDEHNMVLKGGKKKKKDPNAPKGPRGPWIFFQKDKRDSYKTKYPDLNQNDLFKKMSDDWHKMTEAQKSKYSKAAAKDKERYEKEMSEYNASGDSGDSGDSAESEAPAAAPAKTKESKAKGSKKAEAAKPAAKPAKGKGKKADPEPPAEDELSEVSLSDFEDE